MLAFSKLWNKIQKPISWIYVILIAVVIYGVDYFAEKIPPSLEGFKWNLVKVILIFACYLFINFTKKTNCDTAETHINYKKIISINQELLTVLLNIDPSQNPDEYEKCKKRING